MTVIEKKSVPIYEVQCIECKSKIQYKAAEVSWCHITCPVCGMFLWANTICPVKYEWTGPTEPSKEKVDGKDISICP